MISDSDRDVFLDAMRSMAILMVIACHSTSGVQYFHSDELEFFMEKIPIIRYGWSGVDLFFVLSGFLIGKQLWAEIQSTNTINFTKFFIKRGLRIWPLYYATILTSYFFYHHQQFSLSEILPDLLFATNFFNEHLLSGSWSLSIEEQFYLVAPLFIMFISRFGNVFNIFRKLSFIFIFIPSLLRFIFFKWQGSSGLPESEIIRLYIQRPFYCHFEGLWIGMLLADFQIHGLKNSFSKMKITLFLLLAIGLGIIDKVTFGYLGLAVIYGGILYWGINSNSGILRLTLTKFRKPFHLFSKLSYGMYLNHMFLIFYIATLSNFLLPHDSNSRWWLIFCLTTLASLMMSLISFHLIEKPFLKWRDLIISVN